MTTKPGWFVRDGWLWLRASDSTETMFCPAPDGEPYIPTKQEWEQLVARVKALECVSSAVVLGHVLGADKRLANAARYLLEQVPGVDAAFLDEDGGYLYVVAKEHDDLNWSQLEPIEDVLNRFFGLVSLLLRGHQGRDPAEMFPEMTRVI